MFAKRLKTPMKLYTNMVSRGTFGDNKETQSLWGTVWANLIPQSGTETTTDNAVDNSVTHKMQTRFNSSIKNDSYFLFDGRTFDVVSVLNVDEARMQMEILLKEKLAT